MKLDYVTKLAEDHWGYVAEVLRNHHVSDDIIDMSGFHYVSAFIHGYKHALEDKAGKGNEEEAYDDYDGYHWYTDVVAPAKSTALESVERPEVYGGGS